MDESKKIKVLVTPMATNSIVVKSATEQNSISVHSDATMYYSNLSKAWAVSNGIVQNEDYSSKHYAFISKEQAEISQLSASAAENIYAKFSDSAEETIKEINILFENYISDISSVKDDTIVLIENSETKALNNIANENKKTIENINNAAKSYTNLTYTQITNTPIEIPQDYVIEISGKTLTLKSGARLFYPNGALQPEEVKTTSDLSTTFKDTMTGTYFVFGNVNRKGITFLTGAQNTFSGGSEPTATTYIWYDLMNNIVKYNNGTNVLSGYSIPFAIVTVASGVIKSVNVFNGSGYIGRTLWVAKGVKGLIPNGRNADGTCNNIELTNNYFRRLTMSEARTNSGLWVLSNNLTYGTGYTYNAQTNKIEHPTVENTSIFKVAEYTSSSDGTITDFTPWNAFMAVDYNEFKGEVDKVKSDMSTIQADISTIKIDLNSKDNFAINYSAGVAISGDFTASSAGLLVCEFKSSSSYQTVWVNGFIAASGSTAGNDNEAVGTGTVLLSKGDKVTFNGYPTYTNRVFYPCKGV